MAPAEHEETDGRLIAALRSYIPEAMRVTGAPGLNLAVARRGKTIWEAGFGLADLATKSPMTPDTVTRAGSMTKLYTATAVMQLVEQGKLDLVAPVNRYVKDLCLVNPLGRREITLLDLLTFRSGLSADTAGAAFGAPKPLGEYLRIAYGQQTLQEYGGTIASWSDEVGGSYQYSNLGIATLGHIVELTNPDRLTFSEYVQYRVIEPLRMSSTILPPVQDATHVERSVLSRLSTGYARFGSVYVPTPSIQSGAYPATALMTTPGDHMRLMLALLNGGQTDGARILNEDSVRQMLTPRLPLVPGTPPGTGLWTGLIVRLHDLKRVEHWFGHAGMHPWGWWNDSLAFPRQGFALVLSTNSVDMMRWHGAPQEPLSTLIAEFISHWLQRESGCRKTDGPRSFAWKASYLTGVMMVERLRGLLGIEDLLTPQAVEEMCVGTVADNPGVGDFEIWESTGFRAGVQDTLKVGRTPRAIQAFLQSDDLSVPAEELRLLALRLGGYGELPVPADIWEHTAVSDGGDSDASEGTDGQAAREGIAG